MASRGKLIDELTGDITRAALASASLQPEDRLLARQRVQQAIATDAMGAHRDVVAATAGDKNSPEAEPFGDYLMSTDRPHVAADQARPEAASARKLAAELLAADDRTNDLTGRKAQYAQDYIAHAMIFAAEDAARKTPGGASQAPAAAAGAAAGPAAGVVAPPVAAPIAVVAAGVKATKSVGSQDRWRRGTGIG